MPLQGPASEYWTGQTARQIACYVCHVRPRNSDGRNKAADKSELRRSIILSMRTEKARRNFRRRASIDRWRRTPSAGLEETAEVSFAAWLNLEDVIAFVGGTGLDGVTPCSNSVWNAFVVQPWPRSFCLSFSVARSVAFKSPTVGS